MTPIASSGRHDEFNYTGKATVPAGTSFAGTVSTDGTTSTALVGTGTAFETLTQGDYVYEATNNQVRQITAIYAPNYQRIDIDSAFSTPLSGSTITIVRNKKYQRVSIQNSGTANGIVDGKIIRPGQAESYTEYTGLRPFVIDATSTTIDVIVQY